MAESNRDYELGYRTWDAITSDPGYRPGYVSPKYGGTDQALSRALGAPVATPEAAAKASDWARKRQEIANLPGSGNQSLYAGLTAADSAEFQQLLESQDTPWSAEQNVAELDKFTKAKQAGYAQEEAAYGTQVQQQRDEYQQTLADRDAALETAIMLGEDPEMALRDQYTVRRVAELGADANAKGVNRDTSAAWLASLSPEDQAIWNMAGTTEYTDAQKRIDIRKRQAAQGEQFGGKADPVMAEYDRARTQQHALSQALANTGGVSRIGYQQQLQAAQSIQSGVEGKERDALQLERQRDWRQVQAQDAAAKYGETSAVAQALSSRALGEQQAKSDMARAENQAEIEQGQRNKKNSLGLVGQGVGLLVGASK